MDFTVTDLLGRVNADEYRGHAPGTVLVTGADLTGESLTVHGRVRPGGWQTLVPHGGPPTYDARPIPPGLDVLLEDEGGNPLADEPLGVSAQS